MPFNYQLPEWNVGANKPPQFKLDEGWLPNEKPPASLFNWYFNTVYLALKELQEKGYTQTEINAAMASLNTSLTNALNSHANRTDNPHAVTKAQVGLGNVDNVKQATKSEFDTHATNTNNPHSTTKAQVGLGSVDNYGTATKTEAEAGTVSTKFMTPLRTKEAIDAHNTTARVGAMENDVAAHKSATNNPHGVTKSQVGLSSVDNYSTASQAEAEAGTAANRFMTPQRTNQAISAHPTTGKANAVESDLNVHKALTNNPHNVTKAQVGLGSVDNVQQATKTEFNAHATNTSNPHGVTKSQVGLGNVDNVKQATKSEFDTHANNKNNPHGVTSEQVTLLPADFKDGFAPGSEYPVGVTLFHVSGSTNPGWPSNFGTVLTVKSANTRMVQFFTEHTTSKTHMRVFYSPNWTTWTEQETTAGAQAKVDAHNALKNNPHAVTAAQVGAYSKTESDGRYETPNGAQTKVNTHANATNNPHGVTKSQVGLGNVLDYGIATQAEAQAGTSSTKYMTPLRTKQAIDQFADISTRVNKSGDTMTDKLRVENSNYQSHLELVRGSIGVEFAPSTANGGEMRFLATSMARYLFDKDVQTSGNMIATSYSGSGSNLTGITKAQVGLGSVDNVQQATKTEFNDHASNTNNPHGVTKAQVGLGSTPNAGWASQANAEAGTSSTVFMSPLRTQQAIDKKISVQSAAPSSPRVGDIHIW